VGDDGRALARELRIAARVIEMVVGIDHVAHRLVGDAERLERGGDLGGERREFVDDEDDAVLPHRCGDVAAGALQQVDVAGDERRLDLDLAEVLLLGVAGDRGERQGPE
jgi:hypothetical protein